MNLEDLALAVIALLALRSFYTLYRRWQIKHDNQILSAALPRLYIAVMYIWIAIADPQMEWTKWTARLGMFVLFAVEIFNQEMQRTRKR